MKNPDKIWRTGQCNCKPVIDSLAFSTRVKHDKMTSYHLDFSIQQQCIFIWWPIFLPDLCGLCVRVTSIYDSQNSFFMDNYRDFDCKVQLVKFLGWRTFYSALLLFLCGSLAVHKVSVKLSGTIWIYFLTGWNIHRGTISNRRGHLIEASSVNCYNQQHPETLKTVKTFMK